MYHYSFSREHLSLISALIYISPATDQYWGILFIIVSLELLQSSKCFPIWRYIGRLKELNLH